MGRRLRLRELWSPSWKTTNRKTVRSKSLRFLFPMSVRTLFGANPKVVHSTSSPLSGKINVWEKNGGLVLEVGGYPQSVSINTPDLPQRYWYKAVEEVSSRLANPGRAVVIGVGGGTILHLLSRKFPGLKMVGGEIDEEILKIADRKSVVEGKRVDLGGR